MKPAPVRPLFAVMILFLLLHGLVCNHDSRSYEEMTVKLQNVIETLKRIAPLKLANRLASRAACSGVIPLRKLDCADFSALIA